MRNGFFQKAFEICTDREFMKRHPTRVRGMNVIEEFFKKNNFEMPRIFVEDKISTKQVKY